MAILVTGSSGFVGLNVLEALLFRGDEVISFSVTPLPPRAIYEFAKLPGKLRIVEGDVSELAQIDAAMTLQRVDRVIHGAAITAGSEREASEPQRIAAVNVGGTLNMLNAARKHEVKRFVHIGTGAVYGGAGLLQGGAARRRRPHAAPRVDVRHQQVRRRAQLLALARAVESGCRRRPSRHGLRVLGV